MARRAAQCTPPGPCLDMNDEERERAEAIARMLWQGDLLATPVAVVLEAPQSSSIADAESLETVDTGEIWAPAALSIPSGWTAIVSQTCDVVRALDTVEHLQLMPLVELSEQEWTEALNGRRGTLFSLPPAEGLPIEFPAIDCAISFPVSKAALAHEQVETLNTPLDPAARVLLSHWLMRRVGRHAFPDELEQHVLQPLRRKISAAMNKNSQGGLLASCLIGVWSSTEWAASASIIFVVDENRLEAQGTNIDVEKAVEELLGPVKKSLGKKELSVQVTGTARTLAAVSAQTLLVEHRQVDMDSLPVGEFAAHEAISALAADSEANIS